MRNKYNNNYTKEVLLSGHFYKSTNSVKFKHHTEEVIYSLEQNNFSFWLFMII